MSHKNSFIHSKIGLKLFSHLRAVYDVYIYKTCYKCSSCFKWKTFSRKDDYIYFLSFRYLQFDMKPPIGSPLKSNDTSMYFPWKLEIQSQYKCKLIFWIYETIVSKYLNKYILLIWKISILLTKRDELSLIRVLAFPKAVNQKTGKSIVWLWSKLSKSSFSPSSLNANFRNNVLVFITHEWEITNPSFYLSSSNW